MRGIPELDIEQRLSFEELGALYSMIDWGIALGVKAGSSITSSFPTTSLLKAYILPFLVQISSLSALARGLNERDPLAVLCDMRPGKVAQLPLLRSFWQKDMESFKTAMRRLLALLTLRGDEMGLNLPCVSPVSPKSVPPIEKADVIRPCGEISQVSIWEGRTALQESNGPFSEANQHPVTSRKERGYSRCLELPFILEAGSRWFLVEEPPWLNYRNHRGESAPELGPSRSIPYAVCSVLLIRVDRGKHEVLLLRSSSGYTSGLYTLPGGKRQQGESLQQCAAREVDEEIGVQLIQSKPVSIFYNRLPNKPFVSNIGVQALEYKGKPRLKEEDHSKMIWHDLDRIEDLSIFLPAKLVISHYVHQTFGQIEWNDIEEAQRSETPPGNPHSNIQQLSLWFGN